MEYNNKFIEHIFFATIKMSNAFVVSVSAFIYSMWYWFVSVFASQFMFNHRSLKQLMAANHDRDSVLSTHERSIVDKGNKSQVLK